MIAKRIIAHLMILLIALPPQAVMADMLSQNMQASAGGGAGVPADVSAANANSVNAAAAAAQARASAQDMLSRNMMAAESVQAMQDAARAAAATQNNAGANPNFPRMLDDVPDGLGTGGLDFKSAIGAGNPSQSMDNARTIVKIQQTQQQAMLEWNTFNVGRQTTVKFDQSAGGSNAASWIAFNRITDPSGNPSQILGRIEAQGQVYVINQNGIIFGGASEVNTGSLTASSLPINQTLVTNGLLNNPDSEFLFSSPDVPATATAYGKIGNVTVQAGAKITAPTSSANVGGRVALIGPNVTNNGSISTPDGQTILAAGMEVGYEAHSSDDPSLRGLDIFVGKIGSYGGTATNNGLISAERGSVLVTGKNVNQNGFIHSTTSSALNGRVDLLANYNAIPNINYSPSQPVFGRTFVYPSASSTGTVTTGAGSVVQILPEYASSLKVVGTELALKSQINMQGLAIYLGAGSVVYAPNGQVAISAGVWDLLPPTPGNFDLDFVNSSGQIYADTAAVIDVSGSTGIASSISQYVIEVDLRSAELADTPLQRNGNLRGQTVTVDMRRSGTRADGTTWFGTALANLSGYLGVIERNVGELTTSGGSVTLKAGESVVLREGAKVNVAGGYQEFLAGGVSTTRLIKDDVIVAIHNADPTVSYDGIYSPTTTSTDTRWGVTSSTTGLFGEPVSNEASHLFGGAGGTISISAAAMALDGSLVGGTVTGPQQLEAAPRQASLALHLEAQQLTRSPLQFPFYSPTPPTVEFRHGASGLPAPAAFGLNGSGAPLPLRQERRDSLVLSPALLSQSAFGSLTVENSDGAIVVPVGVALNAPAGGSVSLAGATIDVLGAITAPGGAITLLSNNVSPYLTAILSQQGSAAVVPSASSTRGRIRTGAATVLSTAGLIINDRVDAANPLSVAHRVTTGSSTSTSTTHGGNISIHGYEVNLAAGGLIDVSGGLLAAGTFSYGAAGSLSILGGNDPLISSLLGGRVILGASLRGISGSEGGSLTLKAPAIQIGGTTVPFAETLLLKPEFFNLGGFSHFTLQGLGSNLTVPGGPETFAPAISVMPGAVINPLVSRLQASVYKPSGQNSSLLVTQPLEPEGYRNAPVIHMEAPGTLDFVSREIQLRGDIVISAGARILTDALGSIIIKGQTVSMLGEVTAPGGTVSIAGSSHFPENTIASAARTTVHLGSASRVSAAGKTVLVNDRFGRRRGTVHSGGSITVSGNVVAETGAVLDVSGTSAILDLTLPEAGQLLSNTIQGSLFLVDAASTPVTVDSNGGLISLTGGEFLMSRARLYGSAGGASAAGGMLSVRSSHFISPGSSVDDTDTSLLVAASMAAFDQPMFTGNAIGSALFNGLGGAITGMGYFGADAFSNGGFDSLSLGGNVRFNGAVDITARGYIRAADGGVLSANALTRLSAAYVTLGRPLGQPTRDDELVNPFFITPPGSVSSVRPISPTFGAGRLEVSADLVETGFLSMQGIGNASITARQDLRGSGYLDIAGHLSLTVGQLYPVTASTFTLTAYDYIEGATAKTGSITIASSGITPEFPLSAGGRLSIYASTITQGGTLRSPFGSIRLGWDGTGTAPRGLLTSSPVPITQQINLSTGSITSVSAIDPQTGEGIRIPYGIVKDGTNWIDPTGLDITSTGAPDKTITLSAQNVNTAAGSTVDIRGGGELYGYRWIQGNGGSKDLLASSGAFAILPGFDSIFAPFAPFASTGVNAKNLGGAEGYVNETLQLGDRVYLTGNSLVSAGSYTLLPARYALLPGALLVTPDAAKPADPYVKAGGAVITTGYRFNSLNSAASNRLFQSFEIAPSRVVRVRAEYTDYSAQSFISAAQQRLSLPITRGPLDAGYTLIGAQQAMQLGGLVSAAGFGTGRGGRIDISSPLDIVITAPGAPAQPGKLLLNASLLSGWNAESLLIGGERDSSGKITVRTTNLTLDNAGSPLTGTDVILAATQNLTLAAGSSLLQTGTQSSADTFVVTGNGALVRVSGVTGAQTSRSGVTASVLPSILIGANAAIAGNTVTFDSTNATTLDLNTQLTAAAIQLNSGRISIQLMNAGALQPNAGLVLGGGLLAALQASNSLSLLSYSSIDFYGTGSFAAAGALELHAGEIRGFNQNGGSIDLTAQSLVLDNSALASLPGITAAANGAFNLTSNTITIGKNALAFDQFSTVTLTAAQGVTVRETGSLRAQNALNIVSPFIRAESKSTQIIAAGGLLHLSKPAAAFTPTTLGLGASLTFEGSSILAETDVLLPSGLISLRATTGDVTVNGLLNARGVARQFFDATRYTDAGRITLTANAGNVIVGSTGIIDLSANSAGGDAGTLIVNAANQFLLNGTLTGQGGANGSIELDVGSLASFTDLNNRLNAGAFTASRELRVRTGGITIHDTVNARRFLLALDSGTLTVNGTINASGSTGGRIDLIASGGVTLANGSTLNVRGQNFDSAGKGGAIWIESTGTGTVNIASGSTLNLSVDAMTASSASRGQFSGKVHLRARQNATFNDLLIDPIAGTFIAPSSIEIEGSRTYAFNQTNVILRAGANAIAGETLNTTTIHNNNTSFMANHNAMIARLFVGSTALDAVTVLQPGVEIVNSGGSISLGTPTSAALADWNLATFRYGPKNAAGTLTMRASGNLAFYNTLSDGFTPATTGTVALVERMWLAPLSALNTNAPINSQSWNLRLTSGADVNAANFRETAALTNLAANSGSLLLGKDAGQAIPTSIAGSTSPGATALTRLAINPTNNTVTTGSPTAINRFQVIRTGTGDIEVNAGRDVQLLNQFATIYTAGVTVPVANTIFATGDFNVPSVNQAATASNSPDQGTTLGAVQQLYTAQYSMAGGNVSIQAGNDILHLTLDSLGNSLLDSQRQLPNNWLLRRGYVDPTTGNYGAIRIQDGAKVLNDTSASTTWWVNFSNFFDGIAALGGGNVVLEAGRDVQNVSAHAPTNARAARGSPSAANLLELGGGDVTVLSGRNIDGGIYYVERGTGTLAAGGAITTNATRSPSRGRTGGTNPDIFPQQTWLPVTLFAGKSSFDVSAAGDVLLGPVVNTFLMPQGLTNRHWYKTYFSTYSADSSVNVTSLGGDVTFRTAAVAPSAAVPESILTLWMQNELLLNNNSVANAHPWLRIIESSVTPFRTFTTLLPGTLKAVAHTGNINLIGSITLSPSPSGTLELLASGAVNGFQIAGVSNSIIGGTQTKVWTSSTVNLSDASPASMPQALSPYSYFSVAAGNNSTTRNTSSTFLDTYNALFTESGSTTGSFASSQVKQSLHAAGLLHAGDLEPLRVYAGGGDLSGLTLFSGKKASLIASKDITDISFYIQNLASSDLTLVSAGRDIVAYNANSALRSNSLATGNLPALGEIPEAGDIQISGPGTLQVLAGRDLDLGTGSNNTDGTGTGINSIGNGRNPNLSFAGADIVLAAGMGSTATGLGGSQLDFNQLISGFSTPRNLADLAELLGVPSVDLNNPALTSEQQKQLALGLFYVALRNAGRDRNDPNSPDVGTYAAGYRAISALLPTPSTGSIYTQARDVRTKSGGNISILAPGGALQLATTVLGETLAPPGIISESGGNISVFTNDDVSIGIARIFTLRGGDISIWSTMGNIAAGSSSKTIQSAPPTRVIIDPQSAAVATDLAGLATGGGIGVLATVAGVRPGNVDLIAPVGAVDAGDAGIRATGNLNIAAAVVLNAANISVGGTSAGAPSAPAVSTPALGGLASAAAAGAATSNSPAAQQAAKQTQETKQESQTPSIITVEVLGYGGGEGDDEKKRSGGAE